jgi:hypothetical protein
MPNVARLAAQQHQPLQKTGGGVGGSGGGGEDGGGGVGGGSDIDGGDDGGEGFEILLEAATADVMVGSTQFCPRYLVRLESPQFQCENLNLDSH